MLGNSVRIHKCFREPLAGITWALHESLCVQAFLQPKQEGRGCTSMNLKKPVETVQIPLMTASVITSLMGHIHSKNSVSKRGKNILKLEQLKTALSCWLWRR